MNLQECFNTIEELYVFLYDNDINNLSDNDKEKLAENIRKCIDIVDEYEHLLEHIG